MNNVNWNKLGLIFSPDQSLWWSKTHAQVPTVFFDPHKNIFRVFFSARDSSNHSRIGYVDLDADNPKIIKFSPSEPVLDIGPLGAFDDSGVMPSWIVAKKDCHLMYYIGWNERKTIPYHNSVGIAVSYDNCSTFERLYPGPIMDRTPLEPYFCATTCVIFDEGKWKNWYLSCTEWKMVNGHPEPRYHIKYAESIDGISWDRKGLVAIDYLNLSEGGLVRASVIKVGKKYKMWFSYRNTANYRVDSNSSYRIAYAHSDDGMSWTRSDHFGLNVGCDGWDSFMVAYPYVFVHKDKAYLFYNGNNFGAAGFGCATLPSSFINAD